VARHARTFGALREKLEAAQRGLDAVRAVAGSIEKTLW
jgi:hypothetical protein